MSKRADLAGPEIFLANARQIGARKQATVPGMADQENIPPTRNTP